MEYQALVILVDSMQEWIFLKVGVAIANPDLFPCCLNATVTYVYNTSTGSSPALGNQVWFRDDATNIVFRYCHMLYGSIPSSITVGARVNRDTVLGKMGNTGNSTGTHLHLEASTSQAWQCSTFVNPGDYIQIPNIRGTIVEYGGSPTPPDPPPTPGTERKRFPWILYARKLRNGRII